MREGLKRKWLAGKPLHTYGDLLKGKNCQAAVPLLPDIAVESPTARRHLMACVNETCFRAAAPARPNEKKDAKTLFVLWSSVFGL
jgi:hypothetical protein